LVKSLLESTGKAIELNDEGLLNAVTAISGSGPAYFYYFLRSMVQVGEQLGMTHEMAKELACETMLGSYHLVKDSNSSFDELIKAVASKGGTTEAALNTFDQYSISDAIQKGILNAEKRAWELSK
jgi:pyrroline-5-carboxylate reductase